MQPTAAVHPLPDQLQVEAIASTGQAADSSAVSVQYPVHNKQGAENRDVNSQAVQASVLKGLLQRLHSVLAEQQRGLQKRRSGLLQMQVKWQVGSIALHYLSA